MRKNEVFNPKTNLIITQKQHDLLIGTLLGDGSLSTVKIGQTWSYRCLHCAEQKDYLFHKYSILQD